MPKTPHTSEDHMHGTQISNRKWFQSFFHLPSPPTLLLTIEALAPDFYVQSAVYTNLILIHPHLHYFLWVKIPHLHRDLLEGAFSGPKWPHTMKTPACSNLSIGPVIVLYKPTLHYNLPLL